MALVNKMKTHTSTGRSGRLENTLRLIREREGIDAGKIGELKQDNRRANLKALRNDLDDVIADIPKNLDMFDFRLSSKEPPKLWIDDTTFVIMDRDSGDYRLLKETRAGSILLRESDDRNEVSEAVIHYVAERLARYERDNRSVHRSASVPGFNARHASVVQDTEIRGLPVSRKTKLMEPVQETPEPIIIVKQSRLRSFIWFVLGMITGAGLLFTYAWFRIEITDFIDNLLTL